MSKKLYMLILLCGTASSQSQIRPAYMPHATVRHNGAESSVVANHPVPLFQALCALREEYGWKVNWEAAPAYSRFDLVDDTGPRWRAAHPDAKGVTRPAGGLFASTFAEPKNVSDVRAQRDVLAKVVADYNATNNPGKFSLREDSDGQLTIVGTKIRDDTGSLQETVPLLDTPIAIIREPRTVYETIEAILQQLSATTGKKVFIAVASSSLLVNTRVTVGGETVPARELLQQALAGTNRPLQYDLAYDADAPAYGLDVSVASKVQLDGLGHRRLVAIDRYR